MTIPDGATVVLSAESMVGSVDGEREGSLEDGEFVGKAFVGAVLVGEVVGFDVDPVIK